MRKDTPLARSVTSPMAVAMIAPASTPSPNAAPAPNPKCRIVRPVAYIPEAKNMAWPRLMSPA